MKFTDILYTMRSIIFILFLSLISCKQQTGNSHSQDKVTNDALEQVQNTEPIDLDQFINQTSNDEVSEGSESSGGESSSGSEGSVTFSESDGEILTNASLGIIAISCRSCHPGFPQQMKLGLVANTLPPVILMAHYSSIELQDAAEETKEMLICH